MKRNTIVNSSSLHSLPTITLKPSTRMAKVTFNEGKVGGTQRESSKVDKSVSYKFVKVPIPTILYRKSENLLQ